MGSIETKFKIVKDESLCITRNKYGRGFTYRDENGKKITEHSLRKRIKDLVIPPMWTEVHICKWPDGHLQATGRDLKGRKQYIYHSAYEKKQQEEKFKRMVNFGVQLPNARKKAIEDASVSKWNRDKILGLLMLILDNTGIRIGNRQYLNKNGTYGLSTLRRKHMAIDEDTLILEYQGKSNKDRHVEIDDADLIQMIKQSAEQPGYELFRYKDSNGYHSIDSEDVNSYIKTLFDDDFSSKDFRTWVASRLAIELYPEALKMKANTPRKKFTNILLRLVADELGNTPSICKSYYIHPKVMHKISSQDCPIVNDVSNDALEYKLSASEKCLLNLIS